MDMLGMTPGNWAKPRHNGRICAVDCPALEKMAGNASKWTKLLENPSQPLCRKFYVSVQYRGGWLSLDACHSVQNVSG